MIYSASPQVKRHDHRTGQRQGPEPPLDNDKRERVATSRHHTQRMMSNTEPDMIAQHHME